MLKLSISSMFTVVSIELLGISNVLWLTTDNCTSRLKIYNNINKLATTKYGSIAVITPVV